MRRFIVLLILAVGLACFSGCQNNAGLSNTPQPSWDCGLANETSGNKLWEVEQGYYLEWDYLLYYADKSDLSQWIPVCTKADCTHERDSDDSMFCDAKVASAIRVGGNRIYFDTKASKVKDFEHMDLYSTVIGSMALDGSDKRLECYIKDAEAKLLQGEMFSERAFLLTDCFVYSVAVLNQEGTYDIAVYYLDDEGPEVLLETTRDNNVMSGRLSRTSGLYGDEGFFAYALEENANILYRIQERQVYGTDLTDIPWNGGHIEGDTLLVFRSGDGYYQVDLSTGEEHKTADKQMDGSFSHIITPKCILESTVLTVPYLRSEVMETRELYPVEEHAMRYYNGDEWVDVALPEEVRNAKGGEALTPIGLTSDRILLSFKDISVIPNENPAALYQILLTTDTPTLEYLGTIG